MGPRRFGLQHHGWSADGVLLAGRSVLSAAAFGLALAPFGVWLLSRGTLATLLKERI